MKRQLENVPPYRGPPAITADEEILCLPQQPTRGRMAAEIRRYRHVAASARHASWSPAAAAPLQRPALLRAARSDRHPSCRHQPKDAARVARRNQRRA
jgi:hypothetical protein